jgi:hypothetical protein
MPVPALCSDCGKPNPKKLFAFCDVLVTLTETTLGPTVLAIELINWLSLVTICFCELAVPSKMFWPLLYVAPSQPPLNPTNALTMTATKKTVAES